MPSFDIFHRHKKHKQRAMLSAEAEVLAIKAQESLISLGYADKIKPLRLSNHYSKIAMFFAILTTVLYGISGFMYGYSLLVDRNIIFFPELDGLSVAGLISGVSSVVFILLALFRKHSRKLAAVIASVVLVSGSLMLNIFGVTIGILMH